jgi:hypothetical protein
MYSWAQSTGVRSAILKTCAEPVVYFNEAFATSWTTRTSYRFRVSYPTMKSSHLGIGITNLAYWHAKRGLEYGEKDALAEVKSWMEHQAYYLTEATVELAKERGRCKDSDKTRYGKGIFPWELRAKVLTNSQTSHLILR